MTFMAENMTDQKPYEVEGTRAQSNSSEWHKAKWCGPTASNAKDIVSTKSKQGQYKLLKRLLWGRTLPEMDSLKYGKDYEGTAFLQYCSSKRISNRNLDVLNSGFWVNPKYPELGCSPDGVVKEAGTDHLKGVVDVVLCCVVA